MARPRVLLVGSFVVLAALFFVLNRSSERSFSYSSSQTLPDPYSNPTLVPYARYRDAFAQGNVAALLTLANEQRDTYLEYKILLNLARTNFLSDAERTAHYRRVMELHLDDPLARADTRVLWLEYARVAERAGYRDVAIDAYRQAIPLGDAFNGLRRLETNPLTLANIFFQAGQHRNALNTLNGSPVPSIEAPAHRALGEHDRGLNAYDRWLAEQPGNTTALLGRAWSLYYLGRFDEADAAFARVSEPSAFYGRGLIARRNGNLDGAIAFYRQSGEPLHLWFATDLLEAAGRTRDAIPIYLDLATGSSIYADDSAYRALLLAERYGDATAAERARSLLPRMSFLSLRRGRNLDLSLGHTLSPASTAAVALATDLARVYEYEMAIGELIFALRNAADEASAIAIAQKLQELGEFRQSQRAAEAWMRAGSQNLLTWQLAYPRAFPDLVAAPAAQYGVEPALIWAIMREESRFYPQAVSRSNAKGLMQFMPATWDWVAELLRKNPGDPFNPADNILYGTYYLSWLMRYFGGDLELVVPSYNGGQGYIRRLFDATPVYGNKDEFYRFIDKTETREYLQSVMLSYEIYRALYN